MRSVHLKKRDWVSWIIMSAVFLLLIGYVIASGGVVHGYPGLD